MVAADRDEIRDDTTDLAFVGIELRDEHGVLVTDADRRVTVRVTGAGALVGLGTGRPDSAEPFGGDSCTTFDGTALAVVRPTGAGTITVEVQADGLGTSSTVVRVAEVDTQTQA